MKYMIKSLPIFGLMAVLLCGCSTTPKQTAAKSITSTVITVDHAMKGWAIWVKTQRANPAADKITLAQHELVVKNAYVKYQASVKVAWSALDTYFNTNNADVGVLNTAMTACNNSRESLLGLITTLSK